MGEGCRKEGRQQSPGSAGLGPEMHCPLSVPKQRALGEGPSQGSALEELETDRGFCGFLFKDLEALGGGPSRLVDESVGPIWELPELISQEIQGHQAINCVSP